MNFDIGEDIGSFVANGYVAEDGFDFEKPRDIFVPHLALGGSDDGLAHAGDIRSDMQVRERMREIELSEGKEAAGPSFFVMVKGAAHAELTAGERYMSLIAPVAVQFEKPRRRFLQSRVGRRFWIRMPAGDQVARWAAGGGSSQGSHLKSFRKYALRL